MDKIPLDIIKLIIINYLSPKEIQEFLGTHRRYYNLKYDKILWRQVCHERYPTVPLLLNLNLTWIEKYQKISHLLHKPFKIDKYQNLLFRTLCSWLKYQKEEISTLSVLDLQREIHLYAWLNKLSIDNDFNLFDTLTRLGYQILPSFKIKRSIEI